MRSLLVRWRRRALYRRCLASPVRAVVFRYHSVGDPASVSRYVDPGLSISPERFREHLRILQRRFRLVDMDTILERLTSDSPGEPVAAITFDDGYRDNHDVAVPILREQGAVATFFVTSRPLEANRWFWISELRQIVPRLPAGRLELPGDEVLEVRAREDGRYGLRRRLTRLLAAVPEHAREDTMERLARRAGMGRGEGLEDSFLTPDLLRRLVAQGMAVGAHTRSHPLLDRSDARDLADELAVGRSQLELILGKPVVHLAYPNPGGEQTNPPPVRAAARSAGFLSAVTSTPAPLGPGCDPLAVPRLGVYAGAQEQVLFDLIRH